MWLWTLSDIENVCALDIPGSLKERQKSHVKWPLPCCPLSCYHSEMYLMTLDVIIFGMKESQHAIVSNFRACLKPKGESSVVLFTPTATCLESSPSSSIPLLWQCHVSVMPVTRYLKTLENLFHDSHPRSPGVETRIGCTKKTAWEFNPGILVTSYSMTILLVTHGW